MSVIVCDAGPLILLSAKIYQEARQALDDIFSKDQ